MTEVGTGLLHPALLERIAVAMRRGSVGVLYVRVPAGSAAARTLRSWAARERRIAGHMAIGEDHWMIAKFGSRDSRRLAGIADDLAKLLRRSEASGRPAGAGGAGSAGVAGAGGADGGAERSSEALQSLQAGDPSDPSDAEGGMELGYAEADPATDRPSAESSVYRAAKAALLQAERIAGHRYRSPSGSARSEQAAAGAAGFVRSVDPEAGSADDTAAAVIGALAEPVPVFGGGTPVSAVAALFDRDPNAHAVVIAEGRRPVGLLMKEKLYQMLAGKYGLPLYWNRPAAKIMDDAPLVVDAGLPLEDVSQLAMARAFDKLYDVIIITRGGELLGAATIRAILESVTKLRTEAARSANPLTGLPGNPGIQRELAKRIKAGRPFAVIYADLDYFKWFNDRFGFRRGDDMIRYTADALQQAMAACGTAGDYIGHIGGDDFIVLTEAERPERLCGEAIRLFERGVASFYDGTDVTYVSDREGNRLDRSGVTISLSLVTWDGKAAAAPDMFAERAAWLKKKAKRLVGSAYVVQRIEE